MSINFSEGLEETPVVTTSSHLPEGECTARGASGPRTITEYIGQEKAKDNLSVFIDAARTAKATSRSIMFCCMGLRDLAKQRLRPS